MAKYRVTVYETQPGSLMGSGFSDPPVKEHVFVVDSPYVDIRKRDDGDPQLIFKNNNPYHQHNFKNRNVSRYEIKEIVEERWPHDESAKVQKEITDAYEIGQMQMELDRKKMEVTRLETELTTLRNKVRREGENENQS